MFLRKQHVALLFGAVIAFSACNDDPFPFYLYDTDGDATSDASGDTVGSDTSADVAPECTDDDQCTAPETCVAQRCVTGCTGNLDCGGDEPVCDPDRGICVACLSSAECLESEICRDDVCVAGCTGDEDCGDEQTCNAGVCENVDRVCEPSAVSCDGNVVVVCNDEGTGSFPALDCGEEGETCAMLAGTGTCVPTSCVPFERGCLDASNEYTCAEDGSARVRRACSDGEVCMDDRCEAQGSCISLNATSVDFGTTSVGVGSTRSLVLNNCGGGPVLIDNFELDGDGFFFEEGTQFPSFSLVGQSAIEIEFSPAEPGFYEAELVVTTDDGTTAEVDLFGIAEDGDTPELDVQISLTWNDSADLDLHLLRGDATVGDSVNDCHHANPSPDWGEAGSRHDPTLDRDDTDGFGPENINMLTTQENTDFRIVVAVSGLPGTGDTVAEVVVYVEGEEVGSIAANLASESDQWTAGTFNVLDGELFLDLEPFEAP